LNSYALLIISGRDYCK